MTMMLPVATNNGNEIKGIVRSELIAEGPPEEVRQNREVLEAYLGHA